MYVFPIEKWVGFFKTVMLIFQGVYILDLPFHSGSGFRSQKKVIILVVTGWGVDLNYIWPTESLTDPVHFFGGQCSGKWWSNKFGCSKYELMTLDDPESSYLYSSKKIARWWLIQIKFTFYPSFAQKMCFIWGAYSSTGFQQKNTCTYFFICIRIHIYIFLFKYTDSIIKVVV